MYNTLVKPLKEYQYALEDVDNLASIGSDILHADKSLVKSDYLNLDNITVEQVAISTEGVVDEIQKFFKAIVEAAKKLWSILVGYAVKFGQFIKKTILRMVNYIKSYFSKETAVKEIAKEAKEIIKAEQEKTEPDVNVIQNVVTAVANVVGEDEHADVQTAEDAIKVIDELTESPARVDLSNIRYTIDQEYFNLFGYDKNIEIFTVKQIERQNKINNTRYRLVEVVKEYLNPDNFIETLKELSSDNITAKHLRKSVCDKMIEPFYTVDKIEDGDNLTPDNRIDVKTQSIKQIYLSNASSNPITAFRKAIKSLGGSLLPADTKRFAKEKTIITNRAEMKVMLEAIESTIKSIEMNRAHLFIEDKQIQQGFILPEQGLKRLLHDLRLDKNQYAKQIGNTIADLARTMDMLINQQHHTWLTLTNAQMLLLNKQINAIMKAKPVLLK